MKPVLPAILMFSAVIPYASSAQQVTEGELHRPLGFPTISESAACPASTGTYGIVPSQSHIFGSGPGAVWFGTGPVYFKGWSDRETAVFQRTIRSGDVAVPYDFGFKTPVVSDVSYSGPILIRGRELRTGRSMSFSASGQPSTELFLTGQWGHLRTPTGNPNDWRFWPTSFVMPEPGCYGVQIDTLLGTDVLIVEALPHRAAGEDASID